MRNIMSDEITKLIGSVRAGDMVAFDMLYGMYRPLLRSSVTRVLKMSCFRLGDSDWDDLMQEALLSLYKAACSYNEQDNVQFGLFAQICIRNSLITAAKKLSRQIITTVDYAEAVFEDTADPEGTPEERMIASERAEEIQAFLEEQLTAYERRVFSLHLSQRTYAEIADIVGKDIKSVANAIVRARDKLKKFH